MSKTSAVKELDVRRRLLVAESEVNRPALQIHCSEIQTALSGVSRFIQRGRAISPLLIAGGVVAGVLVARKKPSRGLLGKALAGWQLLQTVKPIWAAFAARRHSAGEATATVSSNGGQS